MTIPVRSPVGGRIVARHLRALPTHAGPEGLMNDFDRLHTAGDIRAVFDARTVAHGTAMAVHARRRPDDGPGRVTVVAGSKLGGAVRRNRAKRRLRAALRQATAPPGLDVVVVGRSPTLTADFEELTGEVARLVDRVSTRAGSPTASPERV